MRGKKPAKQTAVVSRKQTAEARGKRLQIMMTQTAEVSGKQTTEGETGRWNKGVAGEVRGKQNDD